jgi:hypothetical protein
LSTKSHMTTRSRTPDSSGGKLATNRLSYTYVCYFEGSYIH